MGTNKDSPIKFSQLADNGTQVSMLQTALSRSETNANAIPTLVLNLVRDEAWRRFALPNQSELVYEWNAADFRRFIESPRPAGCQTPLHLLERMLRGTKAWETFLELTRGEPGAPVGNQNAARDPETNCDNITVCSQPTNTPPPTGTSVSYSLRRLKRNRPDLYEQVKSGSLSANAAMVEAGFREVRFTVPNDPEKAARCLARHFSREQLRALADAMIELCEQGSEINGVA